TARHEAVGRTVPDAFPDGNTAHGQTRLARVTVREGNPPGVRDAGAADPADRPSRHALAGRRAMVMISGLASVSGRESQSPNCSSTARPAPDRNEASAPGPRNRRVLRLTSGPPQPGLVKVWVNVTVSPATGSWTWVTIVTTAPS